MSMLIDVEGERFAVGTRVGQNGQHVYDFTWINGPAESTYGFTFGPTSPLQRDISVAELEEEARLFVRSFFSPDGIGPSDFPDFVAARRKDQRSSGN
jgi:hypothetical protein